MKVPGIDHRPTQYLAETRKGMELLLMADGLFQWPTVLGERLFNAGMFTKVPFSLVVKVEPQDSK